MPRPGERRLAAHWIAAHWIAVRIGCDWRFRRRRRDFGSGFVVAPGRHVPLHQGEEVRKVQGSRPPQQRRAGEGVFSCFAKRSGEKRESEPLYKVFTG